MSLNVNSNRRLLFVGALVFIVALTYLWHYTSASHTDSLQVCYEPTWGDRIRKILGKTKPSTFSTPQKRHRIVVASTFGFHYDVYMALAWTFKRVMQNHGTIEVYAETPFFFGFGKIVEELGLYNGTFRNPNDLIHDLNNNTGDGGIDMVILGTCEADMRYGQWPEELLSAWDARDNEHKFQLVCIVHNVQDRPWQPLITEWSRRSAIRLLTISEHVAKGFRLSFDILSDSTDPRIRSAGYEYIPIDVHLPVLDIPDLPELPSTRKLTKAVIQGTFSTDRRDYIKIFAELNNSLSQDPRIWGYQPIGDQPSYVVDKSLLDPPFHLHIVGSGYLHIPVELKNVVTIHVDLNYSDFYSLMSDMDVCLPAFGDSGYFRMQASSTVTMALECNVPILVTRRIRQSYTYVDEDRLVITRPAAMREVVALRALRSGDASDFLNADLSQNGTTMTSNPHIRAATETMIQKGWMRRKAEFRRVKEKLWRENDIVVDRLLRDL